MGEAIVKAHEAMKILINEGVLRKTDDPKLLIGYDPESDTLSLWNGTPANYGETVAQNLTAETTAEGIVTGITLENAAKLLLPYLAPDTVEKAAPGMASGETGP